MWLLLISLAAGEWPLPHAVNILGAVCGIAGS